MITEMKNKTVTCRKKHRCEWCGEWIESGETSMNLNENPRLENIEISEDAPFADFFQTIVDEIFSTVEENKNRSAMLDLGNLPDSYPFREIQAAQISRETLYEPQTTHTIKKL